MKIIHTFFSLVVTILTVSCYGHGRPALPLAVNQSEAAEEGQFKVSLDLLEKEPENRDHWQQFFEERGARVFWRTLLAGNSSLRIGARSSYRFDLDRLQKEGVANEVGAGIVRYLAYYQKGAVNKLCILGTSSVENERLTSLDPAIGQLKNLRYLKLDNNQLQALPTEIGQLKNLRYLKLDNNQLQALPTEMGQLTNLKELWLQGSQLQALPTEMGQLTNLQALWLGSNQLQALPAEIGQLTNLRYLELDHNQLQALPTEIGQLKNLEKLWLNNNQLQALPTEIQLTNLAMLWLGNNQLQALPTEMGQLTNLQALYLYNNQLQALPTEMGQLKNLKALYLYNNQLQALPTEMGQLTNLQALWLSNNQLACLSEKLLLWYQQVGSRISKNGNPWLKPDDLSKVSREKLEKIAEIPLDSFHDTIRGMAEAAMSTEKFRINLVEVEDKVKVTLKKKDFHRLTVFTLLPHLLRKGQLNRDRRIVFFEGEIPFYVDRELCSQQDVNNILQDLEGKQLYRCLPEAPRSSSKEQSARKRRR